MTPLLNLIVSVEDLGMKDADSDIGALDFPGNMEDTREMEIAKLSSHSSDELSDLAITRVAEHETDSETETDSDDDEAIPSIHPPDASTSIQVPATAPTSTEPTSTRSSMRNRKHSRKFESQRARDIAVIEAKERRKKQREAKANRTGTGTGRTKAAEALAQTSQLLYGVEIPFHSSQ